ncbi:MAG TPA: ABC transporter permease [bacterium]|nr:ABC transporter permease [bacterium]
MGDELAPHDASSVQRRTSGEARLAARSLAAVTNKEFIHILRDPGTLVIALVIPVVLLLLFGYALSLDVREVPFCLLDQSHTQSSQDFAARFTASGYFKLVGTVGKEADAHHLIDQGRARMALLIPIDFARDQTSDRVSPVGLLIDGSNSLTASVILAYTEALMQRIGTLPAAATGPAVSLNNLSLRPRILFNPTQRSTDFLVPGILAIITMFMTILLPSMAVVREKEHGTIEILRSGPIRPAAFIVGKLLPYALICILDLLMVIIVGALVFGVRIQGSFLLLIALSVPFLVTGLAFGLLISTLVESLQVAMYSAFLVSVLPTILLSGFVFPIASMPRFVQFISLLVPARYFLTVVRGIYLRGAGFGSLYPPLLVILLFGTVLIAVSVERLRRSL